MLEQLMNAKRLKLKDVTGIYKLINFSQIFN